LAEHLRKLPLSYFGKKNFAVIIATGVQCERLDGVVAEQGNPKELSKKDSIYRRMKEQQKISQEWSM